MTELVSLIERHSEGDVTTTVIPGLTLMRAVRPSPCRIPGMYVPMVCVIAQGAKELTIGNTSLTYDPETYVVSSIVLPATGRVTSASRTRPYLAANLELDLPSLGSIWAEPATAFAQKRTEPGFAVEPLSPELRDCFVRLLELLAAPKNVLPIAPLIKQEIFYRVLAGGQGNMFRQVVSQQGPTKRILSVIEWLKLHYDQPLRIGALARLAKMSPASLFRHFKHLTAMSPLQYQKQVRLQEARTRIVVLGQDATSAAYAVGYNSPSQFSREYKRFYGIPPSHEPSRA